jgi:hypothetical protein
MSVKEHLRSQIEDSAGSPRLTKNEIELVRYISESSFDWGMVLPSGSALDEETAAERPPPPL